MKKYDDLFKEIANYINNNDMHEKNITYSFLFFDKNV